MRPRWSSRSRVAAALMPGAVLGVLAPISPITVVCRTGATRCPAPGTAALPATGMGRMATAATRLSTGDSRTASGPDVQQDHDTDAQRQSGVAHFAGVGNDDRRVCDLDRTGQAR